MVSTVKRFAMAVLAFWFAIWSVLLPVTVHAAVYDAASNITGSKWYVPAAGTGVAGSRVLATAATALGRANPWIAALTIGTPIMKHILETRGGAEVVIAPTADALPAPAGWPSADNPPATAAVSSPSQSSTPLSGNIPALIQYTTFNGFVKGDTPSAVAIATKAVLSPSPNYTIIDVYSDAACSAQAFSVGTLIRYKQQRSDGNTQCLDATTIQQGYVCATGTLSGSTCINAQYCADGSLMVGGQCYTSPTCPTGYAMNYDTCILAENATNKVKWPAGTNDGARAYIPDPVNSGQWMPHPRESNPLPQGLSDSDIKSGLINAGQTYTKDAYGNPVATTIIPNLSGGYTFNQQVQTTNNNQTSTTTNTYTTNAQGAVTNVSSVTNNGPITNVSNNYTVDIPNDYNKEATQLKIYTGEGAPDAPNHAQTVTQKVTDMNKSITDLLDPIADQYTSDKGKWFSWVWTPPVGQCEPIIGTVHGKNVNWDLCPYVAKVRDVIGWIFAIFGAWVIYNEMFRREA